MAAWMITWSFDRVTSPGTNKRRQTVGVTSSNATRSCSADLPDLRLDWVAIVCRLGERRRLRNHLRELPGARSVEAGAAVREDPAVGARQPVALAVGRGLNARERL